MSVPVAAGSGYTAVLPPGDYTLRGACGTGSARVVAGKRTLANAYCLYP